jgi:hypothetical protein
MFRALVAIIALAVALPAVAQDGRGVPGRQLPVPSPQIEAGQGCPMSGAGVTVGVNKVTRTASTAQQNWITAGDGQRSGCNPLINAQVLLGLNGLLPGALVRQSTVHERISNQIGR